jgi:heme-degrading monooxygenase HmoA
MRRPIAELMTMTLRAGTEAQRLHDEHEIWQILRRKQGYVTHRIYQQLDAPLQWLVYAEWESKKGADGARQHLHGTPLARRGRTALTETPQRVIVELVGAVTSSKGLDLPEGAVAVHALARLNAAPAAWHEAEEKLTKALASAPGHLAHVLFRGFDDPLLVGSLSHWSTADAFEQARPRLDDAGRTATLVAPVVYLFYTALRA